MSGKRGRAGAREHEGANTRGRTRGGKKFPEPHLLKILAVTPGQNSPVSGLQKFQNPDLTSLSITSPVMKVKIQSLANARVKGALASITRSLLENPVHNLSQHLMDRLSQLLQLVLEIKYIRQ